MSVVGAFVDRYQADRLRCLHVLGIISSAIQQSSTPHTTYEQHGPKAACITLPVERFYRIDIRVVDRCLQS